MGRVEARYADWRIGVLSRWAQLWIDRNFALDYTLKSLEKILDGAPYQVVRSLRRILKQAAYRLLSGMLELLSATDILAADHHRLEASCASLADTLLDELRIELDPAVADVQQSLSADHQELLRREHQRWASAEGWQLINVADPCGT
jgi:hypothetical protein